MRLVSQVLTWVMVVVPVLGWIPPLLVPKVLPEPLHSTQDNFDLKKFMGEWYEVAVATNNDYLKRVMKQTYLHTMDLEEDGVGRIRVTVTTAFHPVCREYEQTYDVITSGRFYHGFGRNEQDIYVVRTDPGDYAVVLSSVKMLGHDIIFVLLYSRTPEKTDFMLEHYNTVIKDLNRQLRTKSIEDVEINENTGRCQPARPTQPAVIDGTSGWFLSPTG